jgi:hypothetical protein
MTQPDSKTQLSATGFEVGGGSGHSRCSRLPGDRDYNLTSSAPGASSSGSLAGALIRFPDEFDLLFPPHQSSFFGYSDFVSFSDWRLGLSGKKITRSFYLPLIWQG